MREEATMIIKRRGTRREEGARKRFLDSRRSFLKGAGLAGVGAAAMSSGLLADINDGVRAEGDPIPVGGCVPLTGWAAADGLSFKSGLELACDEINMMGGILGRPLAPVFEDSKEQGADNIIPAMQRLIDRHEVHAIINGYNTGAVTAEYDTIADAGVPYLHHNTDIVHHETVGSDPELYFSNFMADPAEYWYGEGFMKFISDLNDTGKWEAPNKKVAIVTGSQNYSVVIANAMRDSAEKYGWEISLYETVVVPISEWGPTLQKIRNDPPAAIAITHWVPQDLAQFMTQFVPNPTNSLVYMQYGPLLSAFREIGKEATNGVLFATVVGALQDEIGQDYFQRFNSKFGESASPLTGSQPYDSCHYWAIAAAMAGGTGAPGEFEQNEKVCDRIRRNIYRGVQGATAFVLPYQAARTYPTETRDPSLGMPHQFLQVQNHLEQGKLIAPEPYETATFQIPPWISG
jgi:branched-chain amino acid transport system substrate-binding protein